MSLVQAYDVSIAFGDRTILDSVTLNIDPGARIALTGDNGSGKSTLLKILAGIITPDTGRVTLSRNSRVAYLPQSVTSIDSPTLLDEAEKAYSRIEPLKREKEEIERQLAYRGKTDEEVSLLLERRHELEETILESGYYLREVQIEKVFSGLGFKAGDLSADPATFSGGWRMRIALARTLLEQPDLLLLDEPTNYLDIEAREWLESFLADYRGAVVLVSHDRYFLDVTVNRIAELFLGSVSIYHGNYTTYEKQRTAELADLTTAYNRQVKEIQKIEDFIERFRYNASKARLVQSRIRYLEKLDRIRIPETLKHIRFTFPKAPDSGKRVLSARDISKAYGEKQVITGLDLELSRGDRLVLAGMNGAGKSTLMRIIAGTDTDYRGSLEYGTGVITGYFSQTSADELSGGSTPLAEVQGISRHLTDQEIRNLLGAFLFRGDDIYKRLDVLSGGEKSRLALMKLLLSPANLLLLDEPTSHLDMTSKQVLLEALKDFEGTLVFVAHDREFVESLATRVLDLEGPRPVYYYGGYDYFLYRKQKEAAPAEEKPGGRAGEIPEGKKDRRKEKDAKRTLRRLERREEELMESIADLEREHGEIESAMALPENYTDGNTIRDLKESLERNARERERLHAEWERIDDELALLREEADSPF